MTRVVLTVIGLLAGLRLTVALVTGLGLAMSSTVFVLQLLTEKHELGMSHGRASSAILLLQDIAVIPLLAPHHVYRLMDVGVTFIERELYHSSLHLSEQLLVTLGFSLQQARRAVTAFRKNDEAALQKAHAVYKDEAQLIQSSKEAAAELRAILEADPRLAASRD